MACTACFRAMIRGPYKRDRLAPSQTDLSIFLNSSARGSSQESWRHRAAKDLRFKEQTGFTKLEIPGSDSAPQLSGSHSLCLCKPGTTRATTSNTSQSKADSAGVERAQEVGVPVVTWLGLQVRDYLSWHQRSSPEDHLSHSVLATDALCLTWFPLIVAA